MSVVHEVAAKSFEKSLSKVSFPGMLSTSLPHSFEPACLATAVSKSLKREDRPPLPWQHANCGRSSSHSIDRFITAVTTTTSPAQKKRRHLRESLSSRSVSRGLEVLETPVSSALPPSSNPPSSCSSVTKQDDSTAGATPPLPLRNHRGRSAVSTSVPLKSAPRRRRKQAAGWPANFSGHSTSWTLRSLLSGVLNQS